MKYLYFAFVFYLFCSYNAISQNTFFIGTKTYNCTETFHLISNVQFTGSDIDALLAKNGSSAFLVLSINSDHLRIKGTVLLYLEDGSVITCIDKNKWDVVDEIATTIYNLTPLEVQHFKEINLKSIRFSLKTTTGYWASDEGNFSVRNEYYDWESKQMITTNIPNLMNALFTD